MNFSGIVLPMTGAFLIADALPLKEVTPLAQLGIAGIVLAIWWVERKERRERQATDDQRYAELLAQFQRALEQRVVVCPLADQADRIEHALERIPR